MRGIATLGGLVVTAALGCAGAGECTEIGCESETTVTYNGFSISRRYDLTIDLGPEKVLLRCNDQGSMEELENPEYITCTAGGFEIVGEEANHTSILVTLYDIDNEVVIVANQPVQLSVAPAGELRPNGPDCAPVCYERFGSIVP